MGVASNRCSDRPVIGIVSRFAAQKGFDLIAEIGEELMAMDLYIVALGTGEPQYEELFRTLAAKYPDKFLVKVAYDNTLAHQIEAGADMFLMPSRYEPCGLNQIYSLKYGTVPVVRATGRPGRHHRAVRRQEAARASSSPSTRRRRCWRPSARRSRPTASPRSGGS